MNLLEFAKRQTKSYDCSQSKITIAGIPIDSITTATLKRTESYRTERGIGVDYYTAIKSYEVVILEVNILPISKCYDKLMALKSYCDANNTYFGITVIDSGNFVGNFDAHFLSTPSTTISQSSDDKTFSFSMLDSDAIPSPITVGGEEYYTEIVNL